MLMSLILLSFRYECNISCYHRDAAWEKEPGAFDDLYEKYSRCDAELCVCAHGRTYEEDSGSVIINT